MGLAGKVLAKPMLIWREGNIKADYMHKMLVSEIGWYLSGDDLVPFLKIGMTSLCQLSGRMPDDRNCLNIVDGKRPKICFGLF